MSAVLFMVFLLICYLIAHFLGRKRQIGFGWSFFFCLFFNPIVGFIITMLSRKYYDDNPSPSNGKKVAGWIVIVFGSLFLLGGLLIVGDPDPNPLSPIPQAIGLLGLGYYLLELGKGKNFNTAALTKIDD